ncbi:speedy protein E4-like [Suncus etruscus]|uniref:speedy protein E4-like n=1 Tax=Suncus etruscus TaxID=109475 RepID=UPI00210F6FAF|nr:speedy protein E4-like [Suncus etruscus]
MANRGQAPGPEPQSPKISSSGIPLGLEQEMLDPPEHWWVHRPWFPAQGRKRRRARLCWEQEETEEEEEEERDEDDDEEDNSRPGLFAILTRALFSEEQQQEDEEGPCRCPRKRLRLQDREVLPEHHIAFARLLSDPVVRRFLAWDQHLEVSDKYQLAMVVAYFSRFGLFGWQLQRIHFFLALYLAGNIENHQEARETLFSLMEDSHSHLQRPQFHRLRLMLLRSMRWRTLVSRDECEEIQAFDPDLWVWGRDHARLT